MSQVYFLVKCMFERCARRGVSMLFAETVLTTSRLLYKKCPNESGRV